MRRTSSLFPHLLLSACVAAGLVACMQPTAAVDNASAPNVTSAGTPNDAAPDAGAETPELAAMRLFTASRESELGKHTEAMAPALRALVERDNACSARGNVCELDVDPWLAGGGQEGGIEGQPSFETVTMDPLQARVRMDYTYAWDASSKQPQATCVLLERGQPDDRWVLADLLPSCEDARSLLAILRTAYPADAAP